MTLPPSQDAQGTDTTVQNLEITTEAGASSESWELSTRANDSVPVPVILCTAHTYTHRDEPQGLELSQRRSKLKGILKHLSHLFPFI